MAHRNGTQKSVQNRTVQCSTVQCSAVQCSAVQCSAVQCSAVQCSAVQCSAVQCSAVQCSAVQCSAVQCSTVQYSTVQYSTVQCSAVQCSTVDLLRCHGNKFIHSFVYIPDTILSNNSCCVTNGEMTTSWQGAVEFTDTLALLEINTRPHTFYHNFPSPHNATRADRPMVLHQLSNSRH